GFADVAGSAVCMSPTRSFGFSSSSSLDTEKFGRRASGSGIGGATERRRPATRGNGTSFASRGSSRGMIKRRSSRSTRATVSATSASTTGVGPRAPLRRGGDAVLELISAVGEPRDVGGGQLQQQAVGGADREPPEEHCARGDQAERPQDLPEHEGNERQQGTDEQPAQPVEL